MCGRVIVDYDEMMSVALTADWLDPATEGDQHLVDAVAEAAAPLSLDLRVHQVRPLRGDGPELIDPVSRASTR